MAQSFGKVCFNNNFCNNFTFFRIFAIIKNPSFSSPWGGREGLYHPMSSINLAHERFIHEMILHGDRVAAYLAAYPRCTPASARKAASRLLCNPGIKERIRNAVLDVQYMVEEELKEHLRGHAMSVNDKRALLYQVATKQLTATKIVSRYNKQYTVEVKPQINDILRAINLDMKLTNCWKREFDDDAF